MRGCIKGTDELTYWIDGEQVSRRQFFKAFPAAKPVKMPKDKHRRTEVAQFKPILSNALAVHPSRVKEAILDAEKKGVPTSFMKDGRPVMRTRQHYNAYLKAYRFFNRDAGYGDVTRGTFKEDFSKDEMQKQLEESY